MNKFLKSAVAAAAAVTLTAVSLTASATNDGNPCDVNGNGRTDIADAVLIMNYVGGSSNVISPEIADFDKDGFVTNVDAARLQEWLAKLDPFVNDSYTSTPTNLNNYATVYKKYNASTGEDSGSYFVNAAELVFGGSTRSIIGTEDFYTGDYHKGICKIKTALKDGTDVREFTGFVSSDDTIMTAAQALYNRKIVSIQFFNSSGNVILNATATNFSISYNYKDVEEYPDESSKGTSLDYAVINVSDDLSNYKTFEMGYALNRAINSEENVSIAGFKKKSLTAYTGDGRIKKSGTGKNELMYSCDTVDGMVGAPIFRDVVHNGTHHYVVVGINTSGGRLNKNDDTPYNPEDESYANNSGVRICPNITNLVRNN